MPSRTQLFTMETISGTPNERQYTDKHSTAKDPTVISIEGSSHNVEEGETKHISDHTHRKLKPRHIQLIGIAGTIGTA